MSDWNEKWAANAPVLALIISRNQFEETGEDAATNQFDAGAAWENLVLEASERNMVAHAMQGFDYDAARYLFNVPDEFDIMAMVAIGYRGELDQYPDEIKENEEISGRLPLSKLVFEDRFGNEILELQN